MEPWQQRLLDKRADIEEQMRILREGRGEEIKGFIGPTPSSYENAIDIQEQRLALLDSYLPLSEVQLHAIGRELMLNLTVEHQRAWLAESKGIRLSDNEQEAAWVSPQDFTIRLALDLIILALGGEP